MSFTSDHQPFAVYLRSEMFKDLCLELIMRLSYVQQAYGYSKNENLCRGSNPGLLGRESSGITSLPVSYPNRTIPVKNTLYMCNHIIILRIQW